MTRIVVDGRWLGPGGVGSVSRMLLEGFADIRPDGDWVVWGGAEAADLCWPGTTFVEAPAHPMSCGGYRSSFRVPAADLVVFPHVVRPLTSARTLTVIHDTIPMRFGRTRRRRALWRGQFRVIAHASTRILTDSEEARRRIIVDTRVDPGRVAATRLPVDQGLVQAVRAARGAADPPYGLYLGQIAPHKNLRRLLLAFGQSRFAAEGGSMRLVGGRDVEIEPLRALVHECAIPNVEFYGRSSRGEVIAHLAGAAFLGMPSLEEGFGLPVVEAAACGIPVFTSDRPPFDESLGGAFPVCDPFSEASIASALDRAAVLSGAEMEAAMDAFRNARPAVTPADYAREVLGQAALVVPGLGVDPAPLTSPWAA